MKRVLFLGLMLVTLLTAACGGLNVSRNDDGSINLTVNLTESEVNALLSEAVANADNIRARNIQIDLQSNTIVINGEFAAQEGGEYAPGSITVTPAVNDGRLSLTITDVNINGFDASDERITQLNERLEEALSGRAASGQNGNVRLVSISITDGQLSIVLNIQRDQ